MTSFAGMMEDSANVAGAILSFTGDLCLALCAPEGRPNWVFMEAALPGEGLPMTKRMFCTWVGRSVRERESERERERERERESEREPQDSKIFSSLSLSLFLSPIPIFFLSGHPLPSFVPSFLLHFLLRPLFLSTTFPSPTQLTSTIFSV